MGLIYGCEQGRDCDVQLEETAPFRDTLRQTTTDQAAGRTQLFFHDRTSLTTKYYFYLRRQRLPGQTASQENKPTGPKKEGGVHAWAAT